MIQYIYFVKCPDCEDEHFDFFDEAKTFALSELSKKPIITQVEVDRNDFGECVDSTDLGTVWSWEEVVKDIEDESKSVFTKSDLEINDDDPEFLLTDDLLEVPVLTEEEQKLATNKRGDYLVSASSGHGYTVFNKSNVCIGGINSDDEEEAIRRFNLGDLDETIKQPIETGRTLKDLVKLMEENEDEAECRCCYETFPKDSMTTLEGERFCPDCAEQIEDGDIVKCEWCEDYFDKSECDFAPDWNGYLCKRCIQAILSRGEQINLRHGGYNEELKVVEEVELEDPECYYCKEHHPAETMHVEFDNNIKDDVLVCDTCYSELFGADEELDIEIVDDLGTQFDGGYPETSEVTEAVEKTEYIEFEYSDLTTTVQGPKRDADDWDEFDYTGDYTYKVPKDEVATTIYEEFMTDEDAADVPGGLETLEDDDEWAKYLETHFDALLEKYHDQLLEYYKEYAEEAFADDVSYDDLEAERYAAEIDRAYDEWRDRRLLGEDAASSKATLAESDDETGLTLCPECGKNSFDPETGVCVNCGFN